MVLINRIEIYGQRTNEFAYRNTDFYADVCKYKDKNLSTDIFIHDTANNCVGFIRLNDVLNVLGIAYQDQE